jgi:hypothetical protein
MTGRADQQPPGAERDHARDQQQRRRAPPMRRAAPPGISGRRLAVTDVAFFDLWLGNFEHRLKSGPNEFPCGCERANESRSTLVAVSA